MTFYDKPARNLDGSTYWVAELSLVGRGPNGTYQNLFTAVYGFVNIGNNMA